MCVIWLILGWTSSTHGTNETIWKSLLGMQTSTLDNYLTMPQRKTTANWTEVKRKLADFDRTALLVLVHDLYGASKDNQTFLHTRFSLDVDPLKGYKAIISRWLWPDLSKNQNTSVSTAKKAISGYKKAIGQPESVAELTVFYCEQGAGFGNDVGLDDGPYYDALVRMFEQALKVIATLPSAQRDTFMKRMYSVRNLCRDFGYGVYDDMSDLLHEHGVER